MTYKRTCRHLQAFSRCGTLQVLQRHLPRLQQPALEGGLPALFSRHPSPAAPRSAGTYQLAYGWMAHLPRPNFELRRALYCATIQRTSPAGSCSSSLLRQDHLAPDVSVIKGLFCVHRSLFMTPTLTLERLVVSRAQPRSFVKAELGGGPHLFDSRRTEPRAPAIARARAPARISRSSVQYPG